MDGFFATQVQAFQKKVESAVLDGADAVAAVFKELLQHEEFSEHGTSAKAVLSNSCSNVVLNTVREQSGAEGIRKLENLVDAGIAVAQEGIGEASLPLSLLERALESSPVRDCASLWSLLEERRNVLEGPVFVPRTGNPPSKLVLLRSSNALLRRLTRRPQDVELRGRVLLFLAHVCPLTDRSGVNALGRFNREATARAEDGEGRDELYREFWSLQEYVSDPLSSVKSAESWTAFSGAVSRALEAMSSELAARGQDGTEEVEEEEEEEGERVDLKSDRKGLGGGGGGGDKSGFKEESMSSTQFLTSSQVFRLQLGDADVHRQVLTELMIMFDYLLHLPASRQSEVGAGLNVPKMVTAVRRAVMERLRSTPPNGAAFTGTILRLLREERRWQAWKASKCRPLELEPHSAPTISALEPLPAVGAKRERREWHLRDIPHPSPDSNDQLLQASLDDERFPRKSLESHCDSLRMALDPKNPFADPSLSPHKDPTWMWKATRLLVEEDPRAITQLGQDQSEPLVNVFCKRFDIPLPKTEEPQPDQEPPAKRPKKT